MPILPARRVIAALIVLSAASACSAATPDPGMAGHEHPADSTAAHAGMDHPVTIPKGAIYTAADVHFMQGMIAHHAQAIFMTRLAASNGASARVMFLATKIDQSQMPEIVLMQEWLGANGQFVPDTSSYHNMQMPGMLTAEQIARLEKAKGAEFDRQFLELMIQHHEGAIKMVADLFASRGAAQDPDVGGFAADVDVVQTAEIDLMRRMLSDL